MIALIDYGAGNVRSVGNALEELGVEYKVTKLEMDICRAEKVIFPGVGEASFAVRQLHLLNLFSLLRIVKKPMLGICLGMQMFCNKSLEGDVACLGIIDADTEQFDATKINVPHMGWNKVSFDSEQPIFSGLQNEEFFYFAHSFYVPLGDYTIAEATHDVPFTAAMKNNNYYGLQFHPEKSGESGLQILKNFIELC